MTRTLDAICAAALERHAAPQPAPVPEPPLPHPEAPIGRWELRQAFRRELQQRTLRRIDAGLHPLDASQVLAGALRELERACAGSWPVESAERRRGEVVAALRGEGDD